MTMTALLTTVGEVFTTAIGWVGTVASTVAGEPLMLLGCVLGFGGIAISYFKRLV